VLSILDIIEDNVEINAPNLQQLLGDDKIKGLPVVVISINGRKRTGKSFMLTQFLKYLYYKDDPNWIDCETSRAFKWAGGSRRVTPGIQVWSDPIVVEVTDHSGINKKIAIILLDCQGLFDSRTTMSQNTKLFAFSALLSSVFIFNDNTGLSDDILSFLHSYLEYAKFTGAFTSSSIK